MSREEDEKAAAIIRSSLGYSGDEIELAKKLGTGFILTKNDLTREIGSTLTGNQFDKKILALTDPKEYQKQLKTRLKEAEDITVGIYGQVYEQYYKAGMPPDMAKTLALQTARASYAGFVNAINVEYPESTTGIYAIGAKTAGSGIAEPTPFSSMSASEILGRR